MHERARAWFAVCATFLALSLPSAAGAQVLGTVAGNVKDASGAVLPGVTVEVSSPALIEKVRTAVSDGNGPVPGRQPAAGRLFGDLHAPGLQPPSSATRSRCR